MKPPDKQAEQLADEIVNLFGSRDDILLLIGDGSVYGREGVTGLRLVANCLYQTLEVDDDATSVPGKGAGHERLTKIQATLERLARKRKPSWVFCYHLGGISQ